MSGQQWSKSLGVWNGLWYTLTTNPLHILFGWGRNIRWRAAVGAGDPMYVPYWRAELETYRNLLNIEYSQPSKIWSALRLSLPLPQSLQNDACNPQNIRSSCNYSRPGQENIGSRIAASRKPKLHVASVICIMYRTRLPSDGITSTTYEQTRSHAHPPL